MGNLIANEVQHCGRAPAEVLIRKAFARRWRFVNTTSRPARIMQGCCVAQPSNTMVILRQIGPREAILDARRRPILNKVSRSLSSSGSTERAPRGGREVLAGAAHGPSRPHQQASMAPNAVHWRAQSAVAAKNSRMARARQVESSRWTLRAKALVNYTRRIASSRKHKDGHMRMAAGRRATSMGSREHTNAVDSSIQWE